jgi:alpha-galactosidase
MAMAVGMRRCFHLGFVPVSAALCLLLSARPALAASEESTPVIARLADDGRSFRVTANGLNDFHAGWSATIERGGEPQVLSSANGQVSPGAVTTISFPKAGIELLFRLDPAPGNAGVWARAGIRNTGKEAVNLVTLTPVVAEFRVMGNPPEWLVTGLDPRTPVLTAVSEIRDPLDVHEYGGFYRRDGVGFLFGPVGDPVAYVNARFAPADEGKIAFDFAADMSRVRVDPGETRWGQQVALVMEKPRPALARWAEWVAQSHGARTDKGALTGWNNWNFLKKKDFRQELVEVTDAVRQSSGRLHPGVIQIEENALDADVLSSCRQRVAATGARFGTRLIFQAQTNLASPEVNPAIKNAVKRAVQDGFTYLKIICYFSVRGGGGKRTSFESLRDHFIAIRQEAGEDAYLLSCIPHYYYPARAAVGLTNASRVGRDAMRNDIRAAMNDVLRSYQLNNRWFAVDNDTFYTGTDVSDISEVKGGWPLVRTWMSMVGLSCGTAITSDPWYWESFKPHWRNVEVMTPPATERTEVLDLCTSKDWPRLVGHVRRKWGDSTVALLWNPGKKEQTIKLDFAAAGMDPQRRYAVWSFWDNRYLGVADGAWEANQLGPSASKHLVFTDLDRTPKKPVLIGSNLHIYCGAAEIKNITTSRSGMEIELTDAGAREGDLFIYSRWMPILKTAGGCMVSGVFNAGENVWRINLTDRQHGEAQRIELGIVLPVKQQAWFWLLIAVVLASMLFSAWRYVVGVRLQRQHALAGERSRIARDLHDEIGANLSHISILSTLAAKPSTEAATSRRHNLEVASVARQTIQAFDEILWSINPANDTLQSLSDYICRSTEGILAPVDVAFQFILDESFPARPVPPKLRHAMLLAVKEALHNILKHADARRVQVRCTMEDATFVVRITDDGLGFDPQDVRSDAGGRQGHGLENMHRRLTELGGACDIESQIGRGTTITFRLPPD